MILSAGQRWISEAEPELGLGILVFHDTRTLKIDFPGGNTSRTYSLRAAPVKRMRFRPGDRVNTIEDREFQIREIQEDQGLITYVGDGCTACEKDLAPFMDISLPQARLLAGIGNDGALFDLRREIQFKVSRYQGSGARGFLGGRVELIPHQLYIAQAVSRRYFPRVMLSDETGLGKTIEAGLILHRMLVLGLACRVLVVVPDALVHQWFVELYRKFNLNFRIFDEIHCNEARASLPDMNPFSGDQQGIVSIGFIQDHSPYRDLILDAGWDMVVMDEAHHISDAPEFHSFMQALAARTRGLMLLSATPEQMGPMAHFAQLRLLDPDRYFDADAYAAESETYEQTAEQVKKQMAAGEPVDRLLDTFGPGRVVFRNRRADIKGFPGRNLRLTPLDGIPVPCRDGDTDLSRDPRVIYLAALVKSLKPEKLLVICSSPEKAHALDRAVKSHIAVDIARFDETMTLLRRDRQAAWFSREDGARLLICSEIGSEGRNFQFVRHLFLYDLPLNPELLEQRIGRVDRIGQKHIIQLHVPYVSGTGQEVLARWYTQGLPLFRGNVNGLHAVYSHFASKLDGLVRSADRENAIDRDRLRGLIDEAARFTASAQERLDRGKHILLQLNSFKPEPARQLIRSIRRMDRESGLAGLMESLLDHYGIELDMIRDNPGERLAALATDRITDEAFPALPSDHGVVTFDRATAIAREELTFLTWDHPFVVQTIDFFLTRGEGSAAAARLEPGIGPGLFLEATYILEIPGIENLAGAPEFIRARPIHILIDHTGAIPGPLPEDFYSRIRPDRPDWFMELDTVKTELLPELLKKSRTLAEADANAVRKDFLAATETSLGDEIQRLIALQQINPAITDREIRAAVREKETLEAALSEARIRLDAVRLIRSE